MSNVLHSSVTNNWYTPTKYVESARKVMGSIDLDPASCQFANDKFVRAGSFFDIDDDGLSKEWFGNVFVNPPYGKGAKNKSNQGLWTDKAILEVESGRANQVIILTNATPDRRFFQKLLGYPLCFVNRRIKFMDSEGVEQSGPTHGNAFTLIKKIESRADCQSFIDEFSQYGKVVLPF